MGWGTFQPALTREYALSSMLGASGGFLHGTKGSAMRTKTLVLGLATAVLGIGSYVVLVQSASADSEGSGSTCTTRDISTLETAEAVPSEPGDYEFKRWLTADGAQEETFALDAALRKAFGADEPHQRLERGVVGTVADRRPGDSDRSRPCPSRRGEAAGRD